MQPLDYIIWVCVITFALTVIVTFLALLKIITLPNETFLPKLFKILIIEIVIVGVGAFSFTITKELRAGTDNYVKIVTHKTQRTDTGDRDAWMYRVTFCGSNFSSETNYKLVGEADFNGYEVLCVSDSNIRMNSNGTWEASFNHKLKNGSRDEISMKLTLVDSQGEVLAKDTYYSVLDYNSLKYGVSANH